MKSITESLKDALFEGILVKNRKISGKKRVIATNREYDVNIDVECGGWVNSSFPDSDGYGSRIIEAYWSPECDWIFYHNANDDVLHGKARWAAVSPGTYPMSQFKPDAFKRFDDLCMNGATIPEFDMFETNLK